AIKTTYPCFAIVNTRFEHRPEIPTSYHLIITGYSMLKFAIVILLPAVLASLFTGLFFLIRDGGNTRRVVNSLATRVALSVLLLALVLISLWTGSLTLNPTP